MVPETTFLSNVICVLIFGLQVPFVAFFKQLYDALTTLSGEFGLRPCALKKKEFSGIRLAQILAHQV